MFYESTITRASSIIFWQDCTSPWGFEELMSWSKGQLDKVLSWNMSDERNIRFVIIFVYQQNSPIVLNVSNTGRFVQDLPILEIKEDDIIGMKSFLIKLKYN